MSGDKTVVFVCLHGMGMSRLAAAFFNHVAPTGWHAVSAGLAPGAALSPTAARLLEGTSAEPFLDVDFVKAELARVNRMVPPSRPID